MSPKKTAITVELMMMTLYGIEKSGVGTSSSNREVYMRGRYDPASRRVSTPDDISRPRSASGLCSVYLSMSFVNGIVIVTVLCAGRRRPRCMVDVAGFGGVEG